MRWGRSKNYFCGLESNKRFYAYMRAVFKLQAMAVIVANRSFLNFRWQLREPTLPCLRARGRSERFLVFT